MAGNGRPDYEELGRQLEEAKSLESKAKKIRKDVRTALFKYINSHWGEDSAKFFDTYEDMHIGRERRVSYSLREDEFLDKISQEAYDFITYQETKIDEDKLKVAISDGMVYPSTVDECTDEKVTMALVHRKKKDED